MTRILLVDDEARILDSFSKGLESIGYEVDVASSGENALLALAECGADIVVTDYVMPGMDGMALLESVREKYPGIPVIVFTGHSSIESAVEAMRKGAFDYIAKPFNLDEVDVVLNRAIEYNRLLEENAALKNQIKRQFDFRNIIGSGDAMQEVYRIMDKVKDTRSTVLITGQSGTGKELIAKGIHFNGRLKEKPFITVDCASLTESLLESELFGHARGSFTGAHRDKRGYFEEADGGTIFLDEIGEFSPHLQTRLLRILQESEFTRVGESIHRHVNVRVLAATNRNLEKAVAEGRFRKDLFYRLNVITVNVPPLVERLEDIPPLVDHFIGKFNDKLGKNVELIAEDVLNLFSNYEWPGNVRELENVMESIITFCDGTMIRMRDVPKPLKEKIERNKTEDIEELVTITYREAKRNMIEQFTLDYLHTLLDKCKGNVRAAARISGMDRGSFYRLLKKYNVNIDNR